MPCYLADLHARVLAEKASLGIGFDGDGDRIGVVDDLVVRLGGRPEFTKTGHSLIKA
jgi:phosphomannomutase